MNKRPLHLCDLMENNDKLKVVERDREKERERRKRKRKR